MQFKYDGFQHFNSYFHGNSFEYFKFYLMTKLTLEYQHISLLGLEKNREYLTNLVLGF